MSIIVTKLNNNKPISVRFYILIIYWVLKSLNFFKRNTPYKILLKLFGQKFKKNRLFPLCKLLYLILLRIRNHLCNEALPSLPHLLPPSLTYYKTSRLTVDSNDITFISSIWKKDNLPRPTLLISLNSNILSTECF